MRILDLARAVPATLITAGTGWVTVQLLDWYELTGRESARPHDLTAAYAIAAAGIVLTIGAVAVMIIDAVRSRRPIGWAPLIGAPLFIGTWVCGFLVAIFTAPS
ncbi:hypothetical protein [Nocardia cyriacigeorgica]|uniref:hypothetical protein n=1 Tax=Nocardia cyriacigeorgica TaxID=135487 RepID=UPI0018947ADA|nr:hypothetical protein [Nocardia cyriacigeorgica]MBF6289714.1 hypothetical protein [Nocardia cyriacigeorgica]BDT89880.1 hypothetical protein FMUAM8_56440 [Nocardia cyriacigeorgica]